MLKSMLKQLEVVSGSCAQGRREEIHLFHDENWDRQFIIKPIGKRGECRVLCEWGDSEGLELIFASLSEARAEVEHLSQYPRDWFTQNLHPAQVANA